MNMNMEILFFIKGSGIWWGPYFSFPEAQQRIKEWNDSIHASIDKGTYPADYAPTVDFEIIEIPIARRTKVRYTREIKDSRVETLTT